MAKMVQFTYPLDQPRTSRQGFLTNETDAPGNAKWLALPPEAPDRAEKGDLGLSQIKDFESRALTSPGLPFTLKGK